MEDSNFEEMAEVIEKHTEAIVKAVEGHFRGINTSDGDGSDEGKGSTPSSHLAKCFANYGKTIGSWPKQSAVISESCCTLSKAEELFNKLSEMEEAHMSEVEQKLIQPLKLFLENDVAKFNQEKAAAKEQKSAVDKMMQQLPSGNKPKAPVKGPPKARTEAKKAEVSKKGGPPPPTKAAVQSAQEELKKQKQNIQKLAQGLQSNLSNMAILMQQLVQVKLEENRKMQAILEEYADQFPGAKEEKSEEDNAVVPADPAEEENEPITDEPQTNSTEVASDGVAAEE